MNNKGNALTKGRHCKEEVSTVTFSRDRFMKLNKEKYGIKLPNECY